VRVESVLTASGRYTFVSDTNTRSRIQEVVNVGGGSTDDRLRRAVDAANGESVARVFQLSANSLSGDELQLVLAAYETGAGDRVFQRDLTVRAEQASSVVEGFENLTQAYVDWLSAH
jgi:hypothetical protein